MYDEPGPVLPGPSLGGEVRRQHRRLDAGKPDAIRYAMMRLAQLKRMGYSPGQFGLGSEDPTAQYRALSPILGARVHVRAGQPDSYQMPEGMNAGVAGIVQQMLERARQAQDQRADRTREGVQEELGGGYQAGGLGGMLNVGAQLAGSSNREMLNAMARSRSVAKALKHLRKLRPARRTSGLAE